MVGKNLAAHLDALRLQMRKAAENLEFEEAARLRDEVKRLEAVELAVADDPLGAAVGGRGGGGRGGEDGRPQSTAGRAGQRGGKRSQGAGAVGATLRIAYHPNRSFDQNEHLHPRHERS